MSRRLAIAALLALCFGAVQVAGAAAPVPPGPRLAIVRTDSPPLRYRVVTVGTGGGQTRVVAGGTDKVRPLPFPYSAASWSADGSTIAFSGVVGPLRDVRPSQRRIFVAGADGSGLREVPNTKASYEPILSPDGASVAFLRERSRYRSNDRGGEDLVYKSATTWLVGVDGSHPRRLTEWRNGLGSTPSSFSPDGTSLAISKQVGADSLEGISIRLDGSARTVIVRNGFHPVYSPDGTRIAFLRGRQRTFDAPDGTIVALMTDLFTMAADGSDVHRLSRTPTVIETAQSWDPSGNRLAFTKVDVLAENGIVGFGDSIVEINADGSCPTTIASDADAVLFGSAWQPGPGRGAGPIAC